MYISHKRYNSEKIIEQATKEISSALPEDIRLIRITGHERIKEVYEQDLEFFRENARLVRKSIK